MTKQLNSSKLSEDYISAHLPFRGRSASQVLQDDSALGSVKLWGKRSFLKCRLRCVYSCSDLVHAVKNINRSTKVADTTKVALNRHRAHTSSQKWTLWKRFFNFKLKESDVMTKKEARENAKTQTARHRRNAAIFIPDYEEEHTVSGKQDKRQSLELCDLEDSGHYEMNEEK